MGTNLLSFEEARDKARNAGISSEKQYRIWQRNHPDMPYHPDRAYAGQWPGWGDFLGTGRIYKRREDILPFERAREKARLAGILSERQYRTWHKDHPDMPSNPPQFYKEWKGWGEFLGTGRIKSKKEDILPFLEASDKAHNAGISTRAQYRIWQKNHPDMPYHPDRAYAEQWPGWGDFLGTGRIYRKREDVLPFEEARAKARLYGISSQAQYRKWHKDHPDMPSNPPQFYKEWKGWRDFLDTGRFKSKKEDFLSFEEARDKARLAGILSRAQYIEWQKNHPDMPYHPDRVYAEQWPGWGHFLGK